MVSSDDDEAAGLWDETSEGLQEICFEIDQSKSCYTRLERTEWDHSTHSFKGKIVVLGTEATEWNSTAADEDVEFLSRGRLQEACEFAGHVEAITQISLDTRKTEALQLMVPRNCDLWLRSLPDDLEQRHGWHGN